MKGIHIIGPLFDGWYISSVDILGSNSFGTVYLAKKNSSGEVRCAAIRHIPISVEHKPLGQAKAGLEESLKEELALNKDHVSYGDYRIVDRSDPPGFDLFIQAELLTSLPEYLKSRSFSVSDVIYFGISILKKLGQEEPRYHDIKPNNIFYSEESGGYILDIFDVTRILPRSGRAMSDEERAYTAPEVRAGQEATARSDVYSLGLVMYWLLKGDPAPFSKPPAAVSLEKVRDALKQRAQGGEAFADGLAEIIFRACAVQPEYRSSPKEMLKALRALKEQTASDAASAPSGGEADEPPPVEPERKEPKPKRRSALWLVLIVAALALAAVFGIKSLSQKSSSPNQTTIVEPPTHEPADAVSDAPAEIAPPG